MPTSIQIIHGRDFIRANPEGRLDFEGSKQLLAEIASASTSLDDYEIVLDMRKAEVEISITDLWYLAAEVSKLRAAFSRKTAVLCPVEQFDQAGFFSLAAQNRGLPVRAFTSFEDAIEWLISDETCD